jgi:hypothetical protein
MQKAPEYRAFFVLYIQYSGWRVTPTPPESPCLERVFDDLGLDRDFSGLSEKRQEQETNTGVLHCVQDDGLGLTTT